MPPGVMRMRGITVAAVDGGRTPGSHETDLKNSTEERSIAANRLKRIEDRGADRGASQKARGLGGILCRRRFF